MGKSKLFATAIAVAMLSTAQVAAASEVITVIATTALRESINKNIEGAKNEKGAVDQAVKATTGISVKDMKKHGVFGGKNSVFCKPFG